LHLNDSKGQLNENKDRHEHIGLGSIGKQGMKEILKIKYLKQIPIIMETPVDNIRGNKDNMKAVVEMFNN
jgi:deoxyribonuclease-4